MRFSIAVSVLATQAISTSSLVDKKKGLNAARFASNAKWQQKKKVMLADSAPKNNPRKRPIFAGKIPSQNKQGRQNSDDEASKRQRGALMNTRRKSRTHVECDPFKFDAGILQCGSGNYCAESKSSSTGGVCEALSNRNLQIYSIQTCSAENSCPQGSFCDLTYEDQGGNCATCPCGDPAVSCFGLLGESIYNPDALTPCIDSCPLNPTGDYCDDYGTCNFEEFDAGTRTGTFTCYGYSPYCDYDGAYCCFAVASSRTFAAGDQTASSYAYSFYTPISQNVTMSYFVNGNCEVVFNGEPCKSCLQTSADESCIDFDCTNRPGGQAGNTCTDGLESLITAANQCYFYENIARQGDNTTADPCNICGDETLLYPEATIGVDGYEYTCQQLYDYSGYTFYTDSPYCDYAQYFYGPICCQGATECDICGDNGILAYPNATFTIPDYGEVTCYYLTYGGLFGFIGPDECSAITTIAQPVCCTVEEPPTAPNVCLVCRDDLPVTNPGTNINTPGLPEDITCGQLQEFGRQGLIPAGLCSDAQVAVTTTCGCGAGEPPVPLPPETSPPSKPPSAVVTDPPVVNDTDAPVAPTNPPVPVTDPPVAQPSPPPTSASPSPHNSYPGSLFGLSIAALAALYMIS